MLVGGVLAPGLLSSPMSTFASYGKASDGSLSCGVFYGQTNGCSHSGDQLAAQVVYMLAIIAWIGSTLCSTLFVAKMILKRTSGWEYSVDQPTPLAYSRVYQMQGMDMMNHGGMVNPETRTAYDSPGQLAAISLDGHRGGNLP